MRIQHEKDAKLLKYSISGKHIMQDNLINFIDEALELIYKDGTYEKYENAVLEKEVLPVIIDKASFAIDAYDSAQEVIDGEEFNTYKIDNCIVYLLFIQIDRILVLMIDLIQYILLM